MSDGDRPNILVIWGDIGITNLSCYSDGLGYRTPNIDRIADEGMPQPVDTGTSHPGFRCILRT